MLAKYPKPFDWIHIRFSDEVHFGFGPEGKIYILRRPWERYCSDCIFEKRAPKPSDAKRLHACAAIGYNFKSDLIWYDIETNTNGKMSQQGYIDKILTPHVLPWIQRGDNFVLEEDQDTGHGPGKDNIVKGWKARYGLKSYFNCSGSPDLAPIENAWFPAKKEVRKVPHWDAPVTRELAEQGWKNLKLDTINKWVLSMPKRLQKVIDMKGKMTEF
jgi:hypothetical protein